MKSYMANVGNITQDWYVTNADGKRLGRLASEIAMRLRGKHKAIFTPHADTGDFVVVLNASGLAVTGNKAEDKKYYRHTGYPGGIRVNNFNELMAKNPCDVLMRAVRGMLPRGPLGRKMLTKLKIYRGTEHPHQAQQPVEWVID
jgi:large subunit ribosomal protein L13